MSTPPLCSCSVKKSATLSHGHAFGLRRLPTRKSISRSEWQSPTSTHLFMAMTMWVFRPKWGSTMPSCSANVVTGRNRSHRPMAVGVMNTSCTTLNSIFCKALYQRLPWALVVLAMPLVA